MARRAAHPNRTTVTRTRCRASRLRPCQARFGGNGPAVDPARVARAPRPSGAAAAGPSPSLLRRAGTPCATTASGDRDGHYATASGTAPHSATCTTATAGSRPLRLGATSRPHLRSVSRCYARSGRRVRSADRLVTTTRMGSWGCLATAASQRLSRTASRRGLTQSESVTRVPIAHSSPLFDAPIRILDPQNQPRDALRSGLDFLSFSLAHRLAFLSASIQLRRCGSHRYGT